jgi:hypothetical protein
MNAQLRLAAVGFVVSGLAFACSATVVSTPPTSTNNDAGTGAADGAAATTALSAACWASSAACNPFDNSGCTNGETRCDFDPASSSLALACVPAGKAGPGEACDDLAGKACVSGARCTKARCADFCCTDTDCKTAGQKCIAIDGTMGTLGVCAAAACKKPGQSCSKNADCCSNDCHSDHCH